MRVSLVQTIQFRKATARVYDAIKDVNWCCSEHHAEAQAILHSQVDRFATTPPEDSVERRAILDDAAAFAEDLESLAIWIDKRVNVPPGVA